MTSLASVFVEGRIDTSRFGTDIKSGMSSPSIASAGKESGSKIGSHFKSGFGSALRGIAEPLIAAFGAVEVVDFFKGAVENADEARKASNLTAEAIKATGGAAHVTAGHIDELARSISEKAGIDHVAIQSGENLLLRFKAIRDEAGKGNDVFDRTTQVATDMSAALGKSLPSAMTMLGKAINDPVKGLTALGRVGVTFTDQQKKQIKAMVDSGHTMNAQKYILDQLTGRFKGAAAAAATPAEKAKVAWNDFKESVGTALLPVLDALATWFTTTGLPAVVEFAGFVKSGMVPAIAAIAGLVRADVLPVLSDLAGVVENTASTLKDRFGDDVISALQSLRDVFLEVLDAGKSVFDWISQNKAVVATFVGVIGTAVLAWKLYEAYVKLAAAAQILFNAAMAVNPLVLVVVALAALAAGMVYAYQNSEKFRQIVDETWSVVKTVVADGIAVVTKLWATFGGTIIGYVKASFGNIAQIIRGVFEIVSGIFNFYKALFTGDWSGMWDAIKQIASGVKSVLGGLIKQIWEQIKLPFSIGADALKSLWSNMWDAIKSVASGAVDLLRHVIAIGIKAVVDVFLGAVGFILHGLDMITSHIPGITDPLGGVVKDFENFRDNVNHALEGIISPHVTVTGSFSVPSQAQIDKVTAQLGMADGGPVVGGTPGKDSVLRWLMPGEHVLTTKEVANAGGHRAIYALRRGLGGTVPGMASGGAVNASTDATGAVATAAFGDQIMERIATVLGSGMSKALDSIIARVAATMSSFIGGGSTSTSGSAWGAIKKAAAEFGWASGSEWAALVKIINSESGGNPNAQNPTSTAYGIYQFLDGTWAGVGGHKTSDPYLQSVYGDRYIKQRYGDPLGAWAFHVAHGWYDKGGSLAPGATLAFNGTGKTETVTTADDMRDVITELRELRTMLDRRGLAIRNTGDIANAAGGVARGSIRQNQAFQTQIAAGGG